MLLAETQAVIPGQGPLVSTPTLHTVVFVQVSKSFRLKTWLQLTNLSTELEVPGIEALDPVATSLPVDRRSCAEEICLWISAMFQPWKDSTHVWCSIRSC
jgi:hypothetical protein